MSHQQSDDLSKEDEFDRRRLRLLHLQRLALEVDCDYDLREDVVAHIAMPFRFPCELARAYFLVVADEGCAGLSCVVAEDGRV